MGDYRNLFDHDDVPIPVVGPGGAIVASACGDAVRPVRYVLYCDAFGVYLGNFLGLGFWSRLDPAGQDRAVTFATAAEAVDFAATWEGPPPADLRAEHFGATWEITLPADLRAVAVAARDADYATIDECVAAGLPAWDPSARPAEE